MINSVYQCFSYRCFHFIPCSFLLLFSLVLRQLCFLHQVRTRLTLYFPKQKFCKTLALNFNVQGDGIEILLTMSHTIKQVSQENKGNHQLGTQDTYRSRSTSSSSRAGHSPNTTLLYPGSRVLRTLQPDKQDQKPVILD